MKFISTDQAPAAIGPYSQAVAVKDGEWLFLSGQIAIDPATGEMDLDSVESETERILKNMDAVLDAAGFRRTDVVKVTVFMTDMAMFTRMNAIYEAFFQGHRPARAAVEVAALPKNANIEIEAVAIRQF